MSHELQKFKEMGYNLLKALNGKDSAGFFMNCF